MQKIACKSTHNVYFSCKYHVVWCPKYRRKVLIEQVAKRLEQIIREVCKEHRAEVLSLEIMSDHVHLLVGLRATHRLADVLRELKSVSSGWVHDEIGLSNFAWKEGYGAFTVSASQCEAVRGYIEQQDEHHRTRTFREEYLELLRRSGAEFDERYV